MDEIAKWVPRDRSDLFRAAAEALSITPSIVEKDFWVCWVLRRIYKNVEVSAQIHFKGGTSLSKVFNVIERMSEDVDLVIDRKGLGFTDENDPTIPGLSNKARQKIVDNIKSKSREFVQGEFRHAFYNACCESLGTDTSPDIWKIEIADDDVDDQTILFHYPTIEKHSSYLQSFVRLECGARGDTWPSVNGFIRPYAANALADKFIEADTELPYVVSAERTFWDKATVLHRIHHQPSNKPLASRMSRHYYDLYCLSNHEIGKQAINNSDLFAKVVEHTSLFFPRSWAKYELAKPGSLKLTPPQHFLEILRDDYSTMANEMTLGNPPEFDDIIEQILQIEAIVNA